MKKYLVALSLVGLVDAVSYMLVAPSIIFYVLELGGTKDQYGMILSSFSFASFCAKPFLGSWSDKFGFRVPYLFSLSLASLGGLLYFLASCASHRGPAVAIGMVLTARLLGGIGAASSALAYAYMAKVVPNDEQTKTNSLLSMLRILGMASGPGFNVLLADIHVELLGGKLTLDPLNSVGLVLLFSNLLALCSIVFLLEEPDAETVALLHKQQSSVVGTDVEDEIEDTPLNVLKSCWCAEVVVPIVSIFSFNASFQLIETAFAPAASHALSWGPVQTSSVLGGTSVLIFVNMLVVYQLSALKVPDERILLFGLSLGSLGYGLMYFLWTADGSAWHFVLPIVLGVCSFPFVAAPTRSVFTKNCDAKPILYPYHGTMQAVLSMSASVAGFATPGFVAAFVMRTPKAVEASPHQRELSPLALMAPGLSILTLLGVVYMNLKSKPEMNIPAEEGMEAPETLDEVSPLVPVKSSGLRASMPGPRRRHHVHNHMDVHRRESACIMGFAQQSLVGEYGDSEVIVSEEEPVTRWSIA